MYMGLTTEDREAFFRSALELAATCGVKAVVVIEDKTKRPALSDSKNAEDDVVAATARTRRPSGWRGPVGGPPITPIPSCP